MIINQNMPALNTFNSLNKNSQATNKNIQNLSTGRRINGAADDAAGLAISEKMRGQISGLKQGSSNAQDGISMLQTAEGGLDQTHSILQRMRQLAVQSASDTNTADDRTKVQGEVDQLAKEITRISNTTEFNTQNLLAGGLSDTFHIGANAGQNLAVSVDAMDAQSLGVAGKLTAATGIVAGTTGLNVSGLGRGLTAATGYRVAVQLTASTIGSKVTTALKTDANRAAAASLAVTGASVFTGRVDTDYQVKIASVSTGATGVSSIVNSISYSKDNGTSWQNVTGDLVAGVKIDGMTFKIANSAVTAGSGFHTVGDKFAFQVKASYDTMQLKDKLGANIGAAVKAREGDTTATVGDSLTGKTVDLQFNYDKLLTTAASLKMNVKTLDSSAASVNNGAVTKDAAVVAGINVSTQADANTAITAIDNAINSVSQQRSKLGAFVNRLTNTIDNLNTSNENITASESRIRNVDMASEMSNFQKNNILQQAATAMLAKANQQPQSVLQLLQG